MINWMCTFIMKEREKRQSWRELLGLGPSVWWLRKAD